MPRKIHGRCTADPRCPNPATKRGRCDIHNGLAEQARGSSAARGYDSDWRKRRDRGLVRFPACQLVVDETPGRQCGSTRDVTRDHWPESRRQLLARGVADPDDDRFLRTLCGHHHRTETARNQPGGWHAEQQGQR